MIRVTVELVPYGDESRKEIIGRLVLANVENLGLGLCKYDAVYEQTNNATSLTLVQGVKHSRQDGFWVLLHKILKKKPTTKIKMSYTLERLIEKL